jgi:hypothetical protein
MSEPTMNTLILGVSLTAINVALFLLAMLMVPRMNKRSMFDKLMAWRKVNHIAKHLLQESEVERFLIIMLTNGGGDPHPGAKLYATAVVNELDDMNAHRSRDYDMISVDNDYIERVIRAKAIGKQVMQPQHMPEGTLLRSFYEAEKVKYAELYYLFSTEMETFICSAATYSSEHLAGSQGDISIAISGIKKTLSTVYPHVRAKWWRKWR